MSKYSVLIGYKDGTLSKMVQETENPESVPVGKYLPDFDEIPVIRDKVNMYFKNHIKTYGEVIAIDIVLEKSKENKDFNKNQMEAENSHNKE